MKWLVESSHELKHVIALFLTGLSLIFDWPFWLQLSLGIMTIVLSLSFIKNHPSRK